MGNRGSNNKSTSDESSMIYTDITKVTLSGIVINEDKRRNTKTIQLLDANGKLCPQTVIVSADAINSSTKEKRLVKAQKIPAYRFILVQKLNAK